MLKRLTLRPLALFVVALAALLAGCQATPGSSSAGRSTAPGAGANGISGGGGY